MDSYIELIQNTLKGYKLTGAAAALNGANPESCLVDGSVEPAEDGTLSITAEHTDGRLYYGGSFSPKDPKAAARAAGSFALWTQSQVRR